MALKQHHRCSFTYFLYYFLLHWFYVLPFPFLFTFFLNSAPICYRFAIRLPKPPTLHLRHHTSRGELSDSPGYTLLHYFQCEKFCRGFQSKLNSERIHLLFWVFPLYFLIISLVTVRW